jgi:hypothetical protein
MGHSEYDPAARHRRPWNAGRMLGAKRALKPQQVWAIRFWLDRERRLRDRAMFDLAIDSKLRGCDVVKVKIGDLVSGARVRSRAIVIQQKTGRPVQFELLEPARGSILAWLECRSGTLDDFVFPSRIDHAKHISARQYARLVDEWVTGIGLRREDYGTHSLRRTKASIIYKQTGNLRAHLQADRQPPRRADPARSHEDREHRSLSGRRRRGRARPRRGHGGVASPMSSSTSAPRSSFLRLVQLGCAPCRRSAGCRPRPKAVVRSVADNSVQAGRERRQGVESRQSAFHRAGTKPDIYPAQACGRNPDEPPLGVSLDRRICE